MFDEDLTDTETALLAASFKADEYTPTAEGTIVKATNGKTYEVVCASRAGVNTRRVYPHLAEDLGVKVNSKRAKTLYQAVRHTNGDVVIVQSVGRL